uniref:Uncharacterized protein n=1 Tax=Amphimedon queenslandica TaxID=400682 RepID=A0A1X7SQ50_AMPQE
MAAGPNGNQYYLSTSHNFEDILAWSKDNRDKMKPTGYCEDDLYQFTRAAQCVMRFALLRALGLEGYCPRSNIVMKNKGALKVTSAKPVDN